MSYWTYSDLFEEPGPPSTPFHGGFGLINREGIRKPAFFAYKYRNALRGREIPSSDDQVLIATEGKRTGVLVWSWNQPDQKVSNRPFYTTVLPSHAVAAADIRFFGLAPGRYRFTVRRTGFHANDAHTRYLEMGSPKSLSPGQLSELQRLTRDVPEMSRVVDVARDGRFRTTVSMRSNDVVLAVMEPVQGSIRK
jgi:xylan 1,4-beta-xylosidase